MVKSEDELWGDNESDVKKNQVKLRKRRKSNVTGKGQAPGLEGSSADSSEDETEDEEVEDVENNNAKLEELPENQMSWNSQKC